MNVGLGTKDLDGVLAFVADAHDADAPEPLTTELLDRLAALVGCTYASYEENDYPRRTISAYVRCSNEDPLAVSPPYAPPTYWTSDESPLWTDRSFEKRSDLFDRRERERIRDEEEFNAEFRVVDSIGFRVGNSRTRSAVLHFESDGRDFDERARELVVALAPHVEALWRTAVSRKQLRELLVALDRDGDTATGPGLVLHESGGRIDHATAEARRLLAEWFGTWNGRLPQQLVEWVAVGTGERYTERRNGSTLTVEAAGGFTLILTEQRSQDTGDTGLTPRELEVLQLVGEGLSNVETAQTLWITPSTVAKHLEQAYTKLGVHSRTAAVARLAKLTD